MEKESYTHVAFADESHWNQGRFRSIALVSAPVEEGRALHGALHRIGNARNGREFKWHGARKAHGIALAEAFFERRRDARVDVLIWDMEDSRHRDVYNLDGTANFARMYYHLLHNVLKRRWPHGARWLVCPDEQKEVDWLTLEECLGWKKWAVERDLLNKHNATPSMRAYFQIMEMRCVRSHEFPLVQLADLFAGLGVYSHGAFDKYRLWKEEQNPTPLLFDVNDNAPKRPRLSRNDRERLSILAHVHEAARERKFGLSLASSKGFRTRNPGSPVNFWFYVPQHAEDKAPAKTPRKPSNPKKVGKRNKPRKRRSMADKNPH